MYIHIYIWMYVNYGVIYLYFCIAFLFFFYILKCLYLFLKFYYSIIDLQCCVSSRYTAVIQLDAYICSFFCRIFSHVGYHRIMSRVPYAPQQVLVAYLPYI